MRRFDKMMAMATTKMRIACMRASNEGSSMPPPFRAASPHLPLDAFILHPLRNLPVTRYRDLLKACTDPTFGFCTFAFSVMYFPKTTLYPRKEMSGVLRQMSPRYRDCVFEDLDIRLMSPCHYKFRKNFSFT